MKKVALLLFLLAGIYACASYKDLPDVANGPVWNVKHIQPSKQQLDGDPKKGFEYVIYGDYLGTGLPYDLLAKRMFKEPDTVLQREGVNKDAPYMVTVFETRNGVMVGNGNCLSCHGGELDGKVMIGLGNSFSDYKQNFSLQGKLLNADVKMRYPKDSKEMESFEPFGSLFKEMAPYIETSQRGVNPAAMLAEACARHRDPVTLEYVETPLFEMPNYSIATDVPPLWTVRKKNALYYTAVGRGDFTKLLFQASVLGIQDSTAARNAVTNFKDVVAWLYSLEAPKYPGQINHELAVQGKPLFEEHCSGCHGTYGVEESYPNMVVNLDVIKTDPLYASYAQQAPIVDWYNESWFANTPPYSHFEPEVGYIAPPLDGVWATAPYLHNGSVPTLAALLDSEQRPEYWRRSGDSRDYDYKNIGWKYERKKRGKWAYNTHLPGMSNAGHTFSDELTDRERKKLIEYLKTL
jgi:mono/diheme cytochrome c family protein